MNAAPDDLRARFERVREDGLKAIEHASDLDALEMARVRIFGRKSALSSARGALGALPDERRRELGRLANEVQDELQRALAAKRDGFEARLREVRWDDERVDVTLPGDVVPSGGLHPLTKTIWAIVDIFVGLGYRVAEGPEVELSKYNFDALNTPPEHPSRSPQDTYYIAGSGEEVCLRTQTSPVQMRVLEAQPPPVYVVAPGRVYRRDVVDPTHLNSFTQIEGLAVDKGITLGDLKGTLEVFAHEIFGRDLQVRLRPHFFPFTEPSAEMDVECFSCRGSGCRVCKYEGWIEVLGCGLIDPFLLEWTGHDPERYSGFAFGMGAERIAALAHGVNDIRYFYDNDLRFLASFGGLV